jgi:hypothetical protein
MNSKGSCGMKLYSSKSADYYFLKDADQNLCLSAWYICQKSKKLGIADIYREELELCNRVASSSPEKPQTSFSNRESSRK